MYGPSEFPDSDGEGDGEDDDDDDGEGEPVCAPGSEHTGRWTRAEHELFLDALRKFGRVIIWQNNT